VLRRGRRYVWGSHHIHFMYGLTSSVGVAPGHELTCKLLRPGPFELTKLSAQIAVLMERRGSNNCMQSPTTEPRRSPAPKRVKGTWGTAKTIVRDRGLQGLYSGFHLHLREF